MLGAEHLQVQLRRPVPRKVGVQHAVVQEDGVQVALQAECFGVAGTGLAEVDVLRRSAPGHQNMAWCAGLLCTHARLLQTGRVPRVQAHSAAACSPLAWQVCSTLASE